MLGWRETVTHYRPAVPPEEKNNFAITLNTLTARTELSLIFASHIVHTLGRLRPGCLLEKVLIFIFNFLI